MTSSWVLYDGKVGTLNQCLGLADALGLEPIVKVSEGRWPWRWLPASAWPDSVTSLRSATGFAAPWPDALIAAGRSSFAPAAALKRRLGDALVAIAVQKPRIDPKAFDIIIAAHHDDLTGPNVMVTDGALHRVTPARLAAAAERFSPLFVDLPRPLVAVLVGGPNRHYRFSTADATLLAAQLAGLARKEGIGLAVTVSRRTPPAAIAALRSGLAGAPCHFHDGKGDNPYLGLLALADHLLVTADSVSMVSEAAATGKPVQVIAMAGVDPRSGNKFAGFHRHFQALGMTRPFEGRLERWEHPVLDDNGRAAAACRPFLDRLAARRAARAEPAPP